MLFFFHHAKNFDAGTGEKTWRMFSRMMQRTANIGGRIHSFAKWGHICMRS
jgi:hypothetical protein